MFKLRNKTHNHGSPAFNSVLRRKRCFTDQRCHLTLLARQGGANANCWTHENINAFIAHGGQQGQNTDRNYYTVSIVC